jgi:hypothetical protein
VKAYVWFSVAAAKGSVSARKNLVLLKRQMTEPQIQMAAQSTSACIERKYRNC